tara:strand:- start:4907 stop:5287 length:381 start_codon:yes stop_codon:yes gene_type:complete
LLAIPLTLRPGILISDTGKLLVVELSDGRLGRSQTSRNIFVASKWLQKDVLRNLIRWSHNFGAKAFVRCDGLGCLYENYQQKTAFVRHPSALSDDFRTTELVDAYSGAEEFGICRYTDNFLAGFAQ